MARLDVIIVLATLPWHLAPEAADQQNQRCLLLTDGRVLVGQVERRADAYVVQRRYGRITVPESKVERIFQSMHDVYIYRRSQLSGGDASEYVELAYWCLKYKLFEEAKECVREALQLRPGDSRLQRLLRQVEKLKQLDQRRAEPARASLVTASAQTQNRSTLRPVAPEAVRMFARRIQPLISRRCAAAGCHNPGTTRTFALWPSMVPAPAVTYFNIQQLLPYIDRRRPSTSPLLQKAATPHGGAARAPLGSTRHRRALQTLTQWVELVASGEDDQSTIEEASMPQTGELQDVSVPTEPAERSEPPRSEPDAPAELPASLQPAGPRASTPRTSDPFDPDEFNRRYYRKDDDGAEERLSRTDPGRRTRGATNESPQLLS